MKNHLVSLSIISSIVILFFSLNSCTELNGFEDKYLQVKGRRLFSPYVENGKIRRQEIILRGVNLDIEVKDNPSTFLEDSIKAFKMISEIEQTNANCIRFVLFTDFFDKHPVFVEEMIKKTVKCEMIPIVEFHDKTCGQLTKDNIDFLVDNWIKHSLILLKYEHSLILNIGNEVGAFEDNKSNEVIAKDIVNAYRDGIIKLRNAGFRMPIMIDAPFCGINIDAAVFAYPNLLTIDSKKNLLISVHLYDDDAVKASYVEQNIFSNLNTSIPLVVGEFSIAKGCDSKLPNLAYKEMLRICHESQIGWMAWDWGGLQHSQTDESPCPEVQGGVRTSMTDLSGNFSKLRGWGLEVATTSRYSIKFTSFRDEYLQELAKIY
jgi:mannan endo-1,4-beta-mannosidase